MSIETSAVLETRAAFFAALSDPGRLAIVDHLLLADASRSELRSARSQLAAPIWNRRSPVPATSAGTRPTAQVNPAPSPQPGEPSCPFAPYPLLPA